MHNVIYTPNSQSLGQTHTLQNQIIAILSSVIFNTLDMTRNESLNQKIFLDPGTGTTEISPHSNLKTTTKHIYTVAQDFQSQLYFMCLLHNGA